MKWVILFLSLAVFTMLVNHSQAWEVLVVDAVSEPGLEFQVLSGNVKTVKEQEIIYTQIGTKGLLDEIKGKQYDVVWLGWNCTSDDGSYFRENDAELIAAYVEAGGVLVTSASDNNGWKSDWLPAAVTVLDTGDYDLDITDGGKEVFSKPNNVKPADPIMDERYSAIDDKWTVLAWGAGMKGNEAGVIQIAHGKGLYFMVSIDTRNAANTQSALPLMENILNYVLDYAGSLKPVESVGKLSAKWASIKRHEI